jgi:cytochrome P450
MPSRDIHLQYQEWARQYGPIYSVQLGTQTQIVLSSDQAVKDLIDKRGHIYSSRPETYIAQNVLSNGNRIAMLPYGATWRTLRKVIHGLLGVQKAESYVPYQDLENLQMLSELLTQPEEFLKSIRRYTTSLTTTMIYGWRTPSTADPRMRELYEICDFFTEMLVTPGRQLASEMKPS